ncbi:MAG: hypothetical protein JWM20_978 [Patescibacteria group bacterium]|nr:hypothetical protein [Patescibacteria group bacterium]
MYITYLINDFPVDDLGVRLGMACNEIYFSYGRLDSYNKKTFIEELSYQMCVWMHTSAESKSLMRCLSSGFQDKYSQQPGEGYLIPCLIEALYAQPEDLQDGFFKNYLSFHADHVKDPKKLAADIISVMDSARSREVEAFYRKLLGRTAIGMKDSERKSQFLAGMREKNPRLIHEILESNAEPVS